MTKNVNIGSQEISLEANGATPIRFRQLFGKDLLTSIQKGTTENGIDLTVASELAPELAFIMAMSADKEDMSKLTEDRFLNWLEQFGPMDLVNATEQIFNAYFGDAETLVEPKKKQKGAVKEN